MKETQLFAPRFHGVDDFFEFLALWGECVVHLIFFCHNTFFFKPFEFCGEGTRTDTFERALEFTKSCRGFEKISNNKHRPRIREKRGGLTDSAGGVSRRFHIDKSSTCAVLWKVLYKVKYKTYSYRY